MLELQTVHNDTGASQVNSACTNDYNHSLLEGSLHDIERVIEEAAAAAQGDSIPSVSNAPSSKTQERRMRAERFKIFCDLAVSFAIAVIAAMIAAATGMLTPQSATMLLVGEILGGIVCVNVVWSKPIS